MPVQHHWNNLPSLPSLNIPAGEAWERTQARMNWSKETSLAARMVSLEFSKFVEKCFEMEGKRYAEVCSSPCTPKKPVPKVPDQFEEYDSHFSIMLLSVIPPKAKERLLEEN